MFGKTFYTNSPDILDLKDRFMYIETASHGSTDKLTSGSLRLVEILPDTGKMVIYRDLRVEYHRFRAIGTYKNYLYYLDSYYNYCHVFRVMRVKLESNAIAEFCMEFSKSGPSNSSGLSYVSMVQNKIYFGFTYSIDCVDIESKENYNVFTHENPGAHTRIDQICEHDNCLYFVYRKENPFSRGGYSKTGHFARWSKDNRLFKIDLRTKRVIRLSIKPISDEYLYESFDELLNVTNEGILCSFISGNQFDAYRKIYVFDNYNNNVKYANKFYGKYFATFGGNIYEWGEDTKEGNKFICLYKNDNELKSKLATHEIRSFTFFQHYLISISTAKNIVYIIDLEKDRISTVDIR